MQRVVGVDRRCGRLRPVGGEGEVALAAGAVHLQFVEARLGPVGGRQDGEADEPPLDGGEALDVAPRIDAPPMRPRRRVGQRLAVSALLQLGEPGAELIDFTFAARIGEQDVALAVLDAAEDGLEGVEVLLRDRVELVVVTAGAADRQAEEGRRRVADEVGHVVGALLQSALERGVADEVVRPGHEEARGAGAEEVAVLQGVAGQLFADESGVWRAVVEGADDVIAVRPGVGP